MVARCNCFWSDMRYPCAASPGRVRIPDLSDEGVEQATAAARRAGPLSDHPPGEQPAGAGDRRPAQPVADALGLPIEVDERLAEYDRDLPHYIPIEQIARREPAGAAAAARAATCPAAWTRTAFLARITAGIDDLVAGADHDDTVAVFSHGGVINVLLHTILGTERLLCVPRRLRGRDPAAVVAQRAALGRGASTAPNTYGTCCREISGERLREVPDGPTDPRRQVRD